jgi:hypothetical protein
VIAEQPVLALARLLELRAVVMNWKGEMTQIMSIRNPLGGKSEAQRCKSSIEFCRL